MYSDKKEKSKKKNVNPLMKTLFPGVEISEGATEEKEESYSENIDLRTRLHILNKI